MKKQALNILLDYLVDLEYPAPCEEINYLQSEWCEKHCGEGQSRPSRKCWKKYAKLKAKENEAKTI